MTTSYQLDDRVADVAISAKLVFAILERNDEPLTQKQIIEATYMSVRTVRQALSTLEECGAIETRPFVHDPRQTLYTVADDDSRL